MSYIPTHSVDCSKVRSYLTACQLCNAAVVYFECSCGNKVFFDPPEDGKHNCIPYKRTERAALLIDLIQHAEVEPLGETMCPMCRSLIKNSRAKRHLKS